MTPSQYAVPTKSPEPSYTQVGEALAAMLRSSSAPTGDDGSGRRREVHARIGELAGIRRPPTRVPYAWYQKWRQRRRVEFVDARSAAAAAAPEHVAVRLEPIDAVEELRMKREGRLPAEHERGHHPGCCDPPITRSFRMTTL